MTREEAKEILTHNWTRVDNPNYSESELDEAFFMAKKALSADTSRDLISRANAIRWVKTECNQYGKPTLDYDSGLKVIEHLKKMPSELPSAEAEWIPVNERLPSMRTEVIYSFDGIVSTGYMIDRDFNGEKMELHWEDLESGATIDPIAWMPLPKPYREESEVEE